MDAVKYLKERKRFINQNVLGYSFEDVGKHELDDTENAVRVIEQWSAEHPQKTRAQDFFEKYPNAPKNTKGEPKVCAEGCGYIAVCVPGKTCIECWNEPMEETK